MGAKILLVPAIREAEPAATIMTPTFDSWEFKAVYTSSKVFIDIVFHSFLF